jgi:hypothetical protein
MSPDAAFAYVADLTNFEHWDPGVASSTRVAGTGITADTAYDVRLSTLPMTLRYETVTLDEAGRRLTVRARNLWFTSLDTITVAEEPTGDGAVVDYHAELTLNGPLRIADPLLGRSFDRVGDKAAAGLRTALNGEFVT